MKYWDKALSLISGCTHVSPACDNCWLEAMTHRFKPEDNLEGDETPIPTLTKNGKWTGEILLREDRLDIPLKTKKPTIFAIWSDLFHEKVPADFITNAFEVMAHCKQHTFLVCTKRPERIDSVLYGQEGNFFIGGGDYDENIFLGTTVENQEMANKRIPELLKYNLFKLFLSIEPMLEPIILPWVVAELGHIKLGKLIDLIIVGCESGHHARETKIEWIDDLRCQCLDNGIPLWIKQLKINDKMKYDHPLSTIKREELWK